MKCVSNNYLPIYLFNRPTRQNLDHHYMILARLTNNPQVRGLFKTHFVMELNEGL